MYVYCLLRVQINVTHVWLFCESDVYYLCVSVCVSLCLLRAHQLFCEFGVYLCMCMCVSVCVCSRARVDQDKSVELHRRAFQ